VESISKRWSFGLWTVRIELGFAPHWTARFAIDEEDTTISVGVPLASVYASVEGPGCRRESPRAIGVSLSEGHMHWSVWTDPMNWSAKTPRWRDGGVDVVELVLGKCDVRIEDVKARRVWVPMIERSYLATATVKRHVRRWPRWPWAKTTQFVDIAMVEGHAIPMPGKGENSYDCGVDAMHAMSTQATTIEAAIGKVVGSVMETRRQRGWSVACPLDRQCITDGCGDTLAPDAAT
jgi:hypothetical protein